MTPIISEEDLRLIEERICKLLDACEKNYQWAQDMEAFMEFRVPALIKEIRKLKKKLDLVK